MNSSLVMQDFETDSYWAIMTGEAIAGEFKGTRLRELPVGEKMRWRDWVKKHPDTLVLSVNGREDGPDVYQRYFVSPRGFRGTEARDRRLPTKAPIFAFKLEGHAYAVPHDRLEGGQTFQVGDRTLFLYRTKGAPMFESTVVYQSRNGGFEQRDGVWVHTASGCRFNPKTGAFEGGDRCPERFAGLDTFWYNWSLSNPDTELLK